YLKDKGYHLVYLSNSKTYYMNLMDEVFDLCRYFDLMIASEMYQFMPKKMILERIKSTLQKPAIMIGDRFLDIETGMYNKFDTIGCLYGYGKQNELKDATYLITNIKDLEKLL
ncbi:MAG: HAD family hydrolase, partial [Tenericutes bacterium HGW-Tenericutes-6]